MLTDKQKRLKAEHEAAERRRRNDASYTISDSTFLSTVAASSSISDSGSSSSCSSSHSSSSSYDSSSSCDSGGSF